MASLVVNLVTNYRRSEIHHIDVAVIHRTDSRLNRYTILPRVPDTAPGMDLEDSLRLTIFDDLMNGTEYSYVLRLFLNRQPNFELRSESFNTAEPICRGFWFWRRCSQRVIIANVVVTGS